MLDQEALLRHLDFVAKALRRSDDRKPSVYKRERALAYEQLSEKIRAGAFDESRNSH